MNHHEKHSHVAIIGIIALVGIVGVILGSFYYYKHHTYTPAEQPVAAAYAQPTEYVVNETRLVPVPVRHIVEEQPAEHTVTRVIEYHEPEIEHPRRKERRPVNLSLNLGFQKVVHPESRGEWCIYEENGTQSCRPCPPGSAGRRQHCNSPRQQQQQARGGRWTANHDRVVRLMNQFVNQVLDGNQNAARNILERAKHAVRDMRNAGENLQATNQNGATLYAVIQQVLVAIGGRLPANTQTSLNELNSLLR